MDFDYDLTYDSSVWYPVTSGSTTSWQPVSARWGWQGLTPGGQTYILFSMSYSSGKCGQGGNSSYTQYIFTNMAYHDQFGVTTNFPGELAYISSPGGVSCPANGPNPSTTTPISSGAYTLYPSPENGGALSAYVFDAYGHAYYPPVGTSPPPPSSQSTTVDHNGNEISSSSGVWTDTLGTTALTVIGTAPSNTNLSYTAPSGAAASFIVSYKSYTVKTNFGCNLISEYGPISNSLVDKVTLPDGSFYQFEYEHTNGFSGDVTGRVTSVTLPTGGTISYQYSATPGVNGITCADGSASVLQRITPDTGSNFWNYVRTPGAGAAYTTTVTDPLGNNTVIQFQGIYETQRKVNQGSTLLVTKDTCYNASASPCLGIAIPSGITQVSQITTLPGTNNLQSEHVMKYTEAPVFEVTEIDDYDFGPGAPATTPLSRVLYTYANISSTMALTPAPTSVQVLNGSGNTVAQSSMSYDETALSVTSGTPQHIGSGVTARGNLTSVKYYTQGSLYLTKHYTYFDTGNVKVATDVNGATTTNTYSSAAASCGNSFPTGVSEPITSPSLAKSFTWNCTGAVVTQVSDENGNNMSESYTDAYFWRPASVTDPSNAVTSFSYPTSSPYNWTESIMTVISGSSAVDLLTLTDGLGRTHLKQIRQGPTSANYDTVETDYDSFGRISRVTLPYNGTWEQTSSSAPATTTTYDALSRPLVVTDAGNGTVSDTYTQNDTYISVGPPPTGENAKSRQLEYNALRQLTSVCEVTSATQSGSCGQSSPTTGFLTKYSYDALGDLTGVTQNAQPNGTAQTRSFSFDLMGRLTSETNAESGTTNYTYDSATGCTGTYSGDLVQRVDAMLNTACFTFDALHRVLTATYPSGSYASVTPSKNFVYDTATVNSIAMANAKSRLAEAYTTSSSCTGKCTDIGFSYTARGEVSDLYELTPHSSPSYYHVGQTYWAHRALSQMTTNIIGLPTISYGGTIGSTVGLDGEGRMAQVTASGTGQQNAVTAVTYNNSSLPTQVTFGSGDTDIFTYDPNTMRMTQYQFNINSQSDTGTLTWNANNSLQQLVITDAFNSSDNQTCNYAHDDLARIASANCGTAAAQTFSFDAFGNISKTGSPYSFQPTYSASTNRFATLPGFTPTYDANGNVLADGSHAYAWDADGKPISLDGVGLTFDALDRMVEQNRSGTYTEIVYSPAGTKLALMSGTGGQTLQKSFVPLPGNAMAVYTSAGLDHYRHSDWLGSIRLTSSPSRTVLSTAAYAPFGESYAQSGSADLSFTGENQDTVSGDYDFLYREYSTQGRWPSPDPAGIAAVDPTTPQSWNRYAYVRNEPLNQTDPTGLCPDDTPTGECPVDGGTDGGVPEDPPTVYIYDPNTGKILFCIGGVCVSTDTGTGMEAWFGAPDDMAGFPSLSKMYNSKFGDGSVAGGYLANDLLGAVACAAAAASAPAGASGGPPDSGCFGYNTSLKSGVLTGGWTFDMWANTSGNDIKNTLGSLTYANKPYALQPKDGLWTVSLTPDNNLGPAPTAKSYTCTAISDILSELMAIFPVTSGVSSQIGILQKQFLKTCGI
jgi:RHS repeat-associated protein